MAVGLDIGGTKVAGEVRTADGAVLATSWREHRARGTNAVVTLLSEVVTDLLDQVPAPLAQPLAVVGVAVAGWLEADRRHVRKAANLGLEDAALAGALSSALGVPVVLENDGDAAAVAEHALHHRGSRSLVALTAGTGLGGGIILDGNPVRGASGLAGELGHMPIGDPDRECVCGGRGCAELYLSGPGLTASARKAGLAVPGGLRDLVSAARAGDPTASAVLGRAGDTLAQWLALILPVVDPDVVVFGGSAGLAIADAVLPVARRRLAITASLRGIGRLPEISVSRCGPGAAATGAALVGLRATEVRGSLATGPLFAAHPNDPNHRGAPA